MISKTHPRPQPHPDLTTILNSPSEKVSISEFAGIFTVTRVTFTFQRPRNVDTGVRLPSAVRGALGRQLKKASDERKAAGDFSPTAWEGLFPDYDWPGTRRHFAKPFVIWVNSSEDEIRVDISLFGDAGIWRDEVTEAMARAMIPKNDGGEGGITFDGRTNARRIWPVRDVFWRIREGVHVPHHKNTFLIINVTPMVLGNGNSMKGSYADLQETLIFRIGGLARWHGVDIPVLREKGAISGWRKTLRARAFSRLRPESYHRRSRNFGPLEKEESGLSGISKVLHYSDELWPCFVMGTYTNIGFDVTQGSGRYEII